MQIEDDDNAQVVFVKFTTKYHEAAHCLLANNGTLSLRGSAPVFMSLETFMVVMEYMEYIPPSEGKAPCDLPRPRSMLM